MHVSADGMSGAMYEIFAVAFLLDVTAGGAIHFPSGNTAPRTDCVCHSLHAGIAGIAHNLEHFQHAAGWRCTDKAHPGNVIVDGIWNVLLAPNVEQYEIAF